MNDKIKDIAQALDEKYRREQVNLDLKKEKERLCNEMKVLDDINIVLNSTSHNKIGCPAVGEECAVPTKEHTQKVKCRELNCEDCKYRSDKKNKCEDCEYKEEHKVVERVVEKVVYREPEVVEEKPRVEEKHGKDCHCPSCCPNPNPSWFSKNKKKVYIGLLWAALIVLAVGWSPSGSVFTEIQESYVNLLVDFFKMGIFAVAGIITFNLLKADK